LVNHEEDVAGRLLPGTRAIVTVLDSGLFAIRRVLAPAPRW
jgi:hypothetical protein